MSDAATLYREAKAWERRVCRCVRRCQGQDALPPGEICGKDNPCPLLRDRPPIVVELKKDLTDAELAAFAERLLQRGSS